MTVQNDMHEPYDWDAYAQTFFPTAQELVRRASEAEKAGEKEKASELYLYGNDQGVRWETAEFFCRRASAVYRISRFPISRSPKQKFAWTMGKEACLKGLQYDHSALAPSHS